MTKSIKLKDKDGIVYPYPFYPIGSIYLSVMDINPSTYFGGKWEQIAKGRTLVGVDISQSEFNTVNKMGGAKSHTLTANEMPRHRHDVGCMNKYDWGTGGDRYAISSNAGYSLRGWGEIELTGGDGPHNNLQPYFTCYIWLKTSN